MKVSVILSTYQAPAWLEKVLWGYHVQERRPDEVIVADDGSTEETAALLERMAGETGLVIRHVWHRDDGFRKSRILNKAILHARSDLLLFSDGDCIPRRDFVRVHAERARPGRFQIGSYIKLPMATSKAIAREDILEGRCFEPRWLMSHGGLPRSTRAAKIVVGPRLARFLTALSPTRCNFKGSNGSAWLADVMDVNGMDERMPWGGQDREFGVRLVNLGLRATSVRYDAICVHLDHSRGYRNEEQVRANRALRQRTERERITRTPKGIRELLGEGYCPADPVLKARAFAIAAHGDQRYGGAPYIVHLDQVAALLEPYGETALVVGYLRDTLSHTSCTRDELAEAFGMMTAELVSMVSDGSGSERGECAVRAGSADRAGYAECAGREPREAGSFARLAAIGPPHNTALIVKAAERLAHLRACVRGNAHDRMQTCRREHEAFTRAAFRAGLCDELWEEMGRVLASQQ